MFLERVTEAQRIATQKLKEMEDDTDETYAKRRMKKQAKVVLFDFSCAYIVGRTHKGAA